jgi:23S rRNA (cytidine1920-2'-O)/16S rRNA (cytidine1409-2'-O)-methyltransferase
MVRRGLAPSRARAQQQIVAGLVRVNGSVVRKAAEQVGPADQVSATADPYVSRAAHKLLGALDDLGLEVAGRALDAGASTGGFTQVLLERGCRRVYAVDVGTAQLAGALRNDPRVTVWEQTNLREVELRHVGGTPVDLVVADVSFISLVLLVERLGALTRSDGQLLLMVKPQFEVGRELLSKGGVVRSPEHHRRAVTAVAVEARRHGWHLQQVVRSRLPGPAGNLEYFVLLAAQPAGVGPDLDAVIPDALRPGAEA